MGGFWLVCGTELSLGAVSLWSSQSEPALPVVPVLGEVMGDGAGGVAAADKTCSLHHSGLTAKPSAGSLSCRCLGDGPEL